MQRYRFQLLFWIGCLLVVVAALAYTLPALAASQSAMSGSPALQTTAEPVGVRNEDCLQCHALPGQSVTLPSGEILDLTIRADEYNASVHGQGGYACVQCHVTIREFPHPENTADTLRKLTLSMNTACQSCHAAYFDKTRKSAHAAAAAAGVEQAAVCVDCHGAHNTRRLTDPVTHELKPENRVWIAQTCSKCHNAIYQQYAESVHGAALLDENNLDVPTCIDCHGVHDIEDPRTAEFRLKSPNICAKCHTDEEKMAKYGISTYVLNSYVADFHGSTVTLFEKQTPDQQTNKAVCYDCHGIHDISRTSDPKTGLQLQENLLERCKECHPDATANFPSAWLSHYEPSPEKFPAVYYVDMFYKFFIPMVLGGMGLLVMMDFGRKVYDQTRRKPHAAAESKTDAAKKTAASNEEPRHE